MLLLAELVENKPRIKLSSAVTAFYVSRSFNNLSNLVAEIFIFVMDLFLYLEFEMEQGQSLLSLPVLADGVVHGAHVVPGLALKVHPVVVVLPTEGETVHIVGFPLVPRREVPWVATSPLPGPLGKEVNSSQPVAVGEVSVKCLQSRLDQVVLSLAGGLGEEAVVLHAALHGLVPVDGVVVAAATAGVVVAAGGVVTLSVAVIIVRAADPATTSSVA